MQAYATVSSRSQDAWQEDTFDIHTYEETISRFLTRCHVLQHAFQLLGETLRQLGGTI